MPHYQALSRQSSLALCTRESFGRFFRFGSNTVFISLRALWPAQTLWSRMFCAPFLNNVGQWGWPPVFGPTYGRSRDQKRFLPAHLCRALPLRFSIERFPWFKVIGHKRGSADR